MAEADQLRDTVHSGMDQYDRLAIWGRRGARVVDFPYVQPPLSAENAPNNELILSVIGRSEENLPAALLRSHLNGFFGIRSEEHTSELQSLMRISYAVFCLKKKQ